MVNLTISCIAAWISLLGITLMGDTSPAFPKANPVLVSPKSTPSSVSCSVVCLCSLVISYDLHAYIFRVSRNTGKKRYVGVYVEFVCVYIPDSPKNFLGFSDAFSL